MASFPGVVSVDIIEARFAFSGTIARVQKRKGDAVKKGEIIASLDRKLLQTELDRELADYEKVRAEFEIYQQKSGSADTDLEKFSRQSKQAGLDASVKAVELAKYRLDLADLVSPVDGVVVSLGGLVSGLNITPSGNPVLIIDRNSYVFCFDVHQEQVGLFQSSLQVKISFPGTGKEYTATTIVPFSGKDGAFGIYASFAGSEGLLAGMKGEATT